MPKPLPSYLPPKVRASFEEKGLNPKDLSLSLKFSQNKLYSYFSNSHSKLNTYKCLAQAADISLDDLYDIVESERGAVFMASLVQRYQAETVTDLCRKLRISNGIPMKLARNEYKTSSLKDAHVIAQSLDLHIEDLFESPQIAS